MDDLRNILLSLIRSALWSRPADEIDHLPDWDKVLGLADRQTVTGLVAYAIKYVPESFRPSERLIRELQFKAVRICQSHALLNRKLAETKRFLDSHGIHSVLFKGQGVALNYPEPTIRQCGDIDLYVGERNFQKVLSLFKPGSSEDTFRFVKHFDFEDEGVHVEIHRIAERLPGRRTDRLFKEWTVRNLEESELRQENIGGEMINLPPVNFDALYIMNHIWHHFVNGGIGLRQLCDWTLYLHRFHGSIDKDRLAYDLDRFNLSVAWQILACIAVECLGLPEDECPLYDGKFRQKSDMIMEIIWSEGNFGKYAQKGIKPRPTGLIAGKLHSFRRNSSRYGKLIPISPCYMIHSWISYTITGIRNVFNG